MNYYPFDLSLKDFGGSVANAYECECTTEEYIHFVAPGTPEDKVICEICGTTLGDAPNSTIDAVVWYLSELQDEIIEHMEESVGRFEINCQLWVERQLDRLGVSLQ